MPGYDPFNMTEPVRLPRDVVVAKDRDHSWEAAHGEAVHVEAACGETAHAEA